MLAMTRTAAPVLATCLATLAFAGCGGGQVKPDASATSAAGEPAATSAAAKPGAGGLPVLAIMPLTGRDVPDGDVKAVTDLVRTAIVGLNRFQVIERDEMDKMMQQHALQMAGVTSDAGAADLGKLLNAQLMGVGTYGTLLGTHVLTFRIVDVETGQARWAGSAEGAQVADLQSGIKKMVRDFGR